MSRIFKLVIIGWLFVFSNAFAMLELELTQGADNAMPIAVVPFVGEQVIDGADKIIPTISNDLKNSGRFRPVESGSATTDMDYEVWRAKKVEAVIVGDVKPISGGKLSVTFKLFDIYNKKMLFEKDYQIKKDQLRRLAHHISDIVYQQLTGDRGIFSTKIAYVLVERNGKKAKHMLQVADSDGHNPRTLLTSGFPLMSPVWSPDGKKIAYVSFEGHRAAIYIQDLATGKREILSKAPGINGAPAWSPDGTKMAMVLTATGYPKLHILDLKTKVLERVTDGWCLDTEPNWAPDGESLIFTSSRGGGPQIYRLYMNSKKIERLTFNGPYNARAAFTPNGKGIVMLHRNGEMFSIAYEDLASHRIMLLTRAGLNESPSIAPNGKMVVYATNNNNRGVLGEVSIDGRVKLLLPAVTGAVQEPAWSPFLN